MLVMVEGFDKYGPANSNSTAVAALLTAGEWTTATITASIVSGLSATGYAMFVSGSAQVLSKTLAGNYGRLIGGVRFSNSLAQGFGIEFIDGATVQASIQFNVAGTFSVRNGSYNSGTVLATSTASVTANTTHYLEWDFTFANAGSFTVWLGGIAIIGGSSGITGSGDTTATANAYANIFRFISASPSTNVTIDDLYLFDNTGSTNNAVLLTSPRIETQFPTGDGAVQFAVGAAILGSTVARSGGPHNTAANQFRVRAFTPTVNMTLNSIVLMPGVTNASIQLRPVVYSDSANAPGTLMSAGSTLTGMTVGVAKTMPLTTPQLLTAGVQYWLGFMCDIAVTGGPLVDFDSSGSDRIATSTFASGAPGTAPAVSNSTTTLMWGVVTVTGVNWYEVSQNPTQGAQSYVFDATVGHEDLYTYPALSAPPSAIYAVAVKANVAKSDAGAKTVSVRLKSGATDSAGTGGTLAPGTSYGWLTSHYPTDPNGSVPWTLSALNAAQAGVKVET